MKPSNPIQTLPDDIVKYILCDFMDDLVHMTRFLMTSKRLYNVREWPQKKRICIDRRANKISKESLNPIMIQLRKLTNLEVLRQNKFWKLPTWSILDWLSQLTSLRDISLIWGSPDDRDFESPKVEFCSPHLRSVRLYTANSSFNHVPPFIFDEILLSNGLQLEEFLLSARYMAKQWGHALPLKNLRLLEIQYSWSSIEDMKIILPQLNGYCKVDIQFDPQPTTRNGKQSCIPSDFSTKFLPLRSSLELIQASCDECFGIRIPLERILINGRPFASFLIDVIQRGQHDQASSKPPPSSGFSDSLKYGDRLRVVLDLYKQVKVLAPRFAIQHFVDLVRWIGREPLFRATPEWLWLITEEFENLLANYDTYDPYEDCFIGFCSVFLARPEEMLATTLDTLVTFIASHEHERDVLSVFSRLAEDQDSSFRSAPFHVFSHATLGPIAVSVLNAFSVDRLVDLSDEALTSLFAHPDCKIAYSEELFDAFFAESWTRSWPLLKILLQMRINQNNTRSEAPPKTVHRFAGFLRFDGVAAGVNASLAAADLLDDEALMKEFALVFIDAPLLFRKEHVDSRLLRCIREPNAADRCIRPFLVLQDAYCGDDTKPNKDYTHLCTDERLASLFCRSILSNLAQDFSQFVAAALDMFPPLAAELNVFCSGKSTLYVEEIRSTNVSVSEAIKIIEYALIKADYELRGLDTSIEDFEYDYDAQYDSNVSQDYGVSSSVDDGDA
eukprot:TRINITY_DN1914_c0_g2_i1.p1 TRINITY_DN1914_c0_g2~~TRINITY_DN1914_c0_g2_i1.p1  ORF type:complete len:728 (-),score=124.82 TRINITY_DN1914_c0_g2_i1:50-2233(-)